MLELSGGFLAAAAIISALRLPLHGKDAPAVRSRDLVTCPGHVSWSRVLVTCPGHVSTHNNNNNNNNNNNK